MTYSRSHWRPNFEVIGHSPAPSKHRPRTSVSTLSLSRFPRKCIFLGHYHPKFLSPRTPASPNRWWWINASDASSWYTLSNCTSMMHLSGGVVVHFVRKTRTARTSSTTVLSHMDDLAPSSGAISDEWQRDYCRASTLAALVCNCNWSPRLPWNLLNHRHHLFVCPRGPFEHPKTWSTWTTKKKIQDSENNSKIVKNLLIF